MQTLLFFSCTYFIAHFHENDTGKDQARICGNAIYFQKLRLN